MENWHMLVINKLSSVEGVDKDMWLRQQPANEARMNISQTPPFSCSKCCAIPVLQIDNFFSSCVITNDTPLIIAQHLGTSGDLFISL